MTVLSLVYVLCLYNLFSNIQSQCTNYNNPTKLFYLDILSSQMENYICLKTALQNL